MQHSGSPAIAAITASAAAGPVFLIAGLGAGLYLQLPAPIEIRGQDLLIVAVALVPAFVVGFILGLLPNLVGATMMAALADRIETARAPAVWTLAGGLAGLAIHQLVLPAGSGLEPAFALVATSAICARICRRQLHWDCAQA